MGAISSGGAVRSLATKLQLGDERAVDNAPPRRKGYPSTPCVRGTLRRGEWIAL